MLESVDRLMLTTVRLTSFFNEQELGHATGFFYHGLLDGKANYWHVTNWHVVSGRNALDPTVCLNRKTGAVPNRNRIGLLAGRGLLPLIEVIDRHKTAAPLGWNADDYEEDQGTLCRRCR
jgi:hypothetical protein